MEQNRSFGLINEEIGEDALGYNLNNIMENYYNFKYLNPLLEASSKKQYDFLIKGYSANPDYNLMIVTPLESSKGLLDDYTILYDRKKKLIVEVSTEVSPTTFANVEDKKAVGSKNIYKSLFKTMFRIDAFGYYLVGSKEEIGFSKIDKKKTTDIEVKIVFIITGISDNGFTYKDSEVFKDRTLYNKKFYTNQLLGSFWTNDDGTRTENNFRFRI